MTSEFIPFNVSRRLITLQVIAAGLDTMMANLLKGF
jgi:hypothetical protein